MEAYALTDTGRVRSMNQDYIYASPEKVGSLPDLFLVADGMGGHKRRLCFPFYGGKSGGVFKSSSGWPLCYPVKGWDKNGE